MRRWLAAWSIAAILAAAHGRARGRRSAEGLPRRGPASALGASQGQAGSGFDVLLAQAIADRLGRPLTIQWFESKLDEDSSPQLEANALLSDGRCSLVGGYALTRIPSSSPA